MNQAPIFKGKKVLVVDDQQDNLEVLRVVTSFHGAQVDVAEDGSLARDYLENTRPDLVLLDISMPVMNGWELIRYIRSSPRLADLVVIAVTAHAMQGDREQVLAAGFDGYVAKPYKINNVVQQIAEIIERKAQHG